jgi:hypothetical protein
VLIIFDRLKTLKDTLDDFKCIFIENLLFVLCIKYFIIKHTMIIVKWHAFMQLIIRYWFKHIKFYLFKLDWETSVCYLY